MSLSQLTQLSFFQIPDWDVFGFPAKNSPMPKYPFTYKTDTLVKLYEFSLKSQVPLTIAITYFTSVHLCNSYILKKQKEQKLINDKKEGDSKSSSTSSKKLPAVPTRISQTAFFKWFVLFHNMMLCVYSIWTFVSVTSIIKLTSINYKSLVRNFNIPTETSVFWNAICDLNNGIFSEKLVRGLGFFGYFFYLSKFYEILDTIIILLKGRPSSLLQSYHHSGAMLSMWSGIRYTSPPIWIFCAFNSFIHSLMYLYYTLSCLKIRVPQVFKKTLTSLQIVQFIAGGGLAVVHLFVHYFDYAQNSYEPCIKDANQLFALTVNVFYLFPLTVLFVIFWLESYARRSK